MKINELEWLFVFKKEISLFVREFNNILNKKEFGYIPTFFAINIQIITLLVSVLRALSIKQAFLSPYQRSWAIKKALTSFFHSTCTTINSEPRLMNSFLWVFKISLHLSGSLTKACQNCSNKYNTKVNINYFEIKNKMVRKVDHLL